MYQPVHTKLGTDSHHQELLHEAEMHRLRQSLKAEKAEQAARIWVPISTFLKLRK